MSTYAVYGEIIFPAVRDRELIKIRRFSSIKIESSWKSLTSTAEIVLPRKIKDFDRERISQVFHEGDPVIIKYGYDGELNEEFSGYISRVPAGVPLTIYCEDEMYLLKRKRVSVTNDKDFSLKKLLQTIAPGYEVSCDETTLVGTVRYSNYSVSAIFDDLKKKNINIWFEGKTLKAFTTSKSDLPPVEVILEKTAGESLKQKAIEDVYVIIKCLKREAKKRHKYITVKFGDEGAGCTIEKEICGIDLTQLELMNEAKAIYVQKKTPGLDGDITLFGRPRVTHGMKIKLSSILYPEKDGIYYVDSVTKKLSEEGIRQICKIGDKAA